MHNYIVNASIQLVPLAQDRHPYEWVDEAIHIIKSSGIQHEVGPFATVMEGTYREVMDVVDRINDHLLQKGCPEWITSLQLQIRSNGDMRGEEKIAKHQ